MREPVERSGSLIAVDDLNEYNLDRALRLGGFPKPSIAVARRNVGRQNFGDISLVFAKKPAPSLCRGGGLGGAMGGDVVCAEGRRCGAAHGLRRGG